MTDIKPFVPVKEIPFEKLSKKQQAKRKKFIDNIRSCFDDDETTRNENAR